MRKLRLDVHELKVETFHTFLKDDPEAGTVEAYATAFQTGVCYSCVATCIESCRDTCNNSLDYCTCPDTCEDTCGTCWFTCAGDTCNDTCHTNICACNLSDFGTCIC